MTEHTRVASTPAARVCDHGVVWTKDKSHYTLSQPEEHVRLLLPEHGCIPARLRFRLLREEIDTPGDTTQWSVFDSASEHGSSARDGTVIVVREERLSEDEDPGDVHHIVDAWMIPAAIICTAQELTGVDGSTIEEILALHLFQRIRISHTVMPQRSIPIEDAATIDPRILELASNVAARVAAQAGLVLEGVFERVGYRYEESVGSNLNETVGNSWRWRVGFRVRMRDVAGLLVLAIEAYGVDTHEIGWSHWLNEEDIDGWMILPSSGKDDDLRVEGLPLEASWLAAS